MTRSEHLQWCKDRAIAIANTGDVAQALASMASDTSKHEETRMHASTNQLGLMMLLDGHISTPAEMVKFIEGYN